MQKIFPLLLLALFFFACNTVQDQTASGNASTKEMASVPGHFSGGLSEYWYEGKAEVNTYDLTQARYGELRPGQVSMIFVSEDFLTDKQVKNDNYKNPNSTPVIKTNMIRRFITGIYDYSVMTSIFTPTETAKEPHTLKVTTSMQDWCGQTFTQLNYQGGGNWNKQLRSYFEREGDVNEQVTADFLEDELFNRIRSGWETLPVGDYQIIPATSYLLLTHKPYQSAAASTMVKDYDGTDFAGTGLKTYVVDYSPLGRRLEIIFDSNAPYVIRGWLETYSERGQSLTTKATLSHQIRTPYWSQNRTEDEPLRKEIGLEM